jgi:hypothetical protein
MTTRSEVALNYKELRIINPTRSDLPKPKNGVRDSDHFIYNLPSCRAVRVRGQIQYIHLSVGVKVEFVFGFLKKSNLDK